MQKIFYIDTERPLTRCIYGRSQPSPPNPDTHYCNTVFSRLLLVHRIQNYHFHHKVCKTHLEPCGLACIWRGDSPGPVQLFLVRKRVIFQRWLLLNFMEYPGNFEPHIPFFSADTILMTISKIGTRYYENLKFFIQTKHIRSVVLCNRQSVTKLNSLGIFHGIH